MHRAVRLLAAGGLIVLVIGLVLPAIGPLRGRLKACELTTGRDAVPAPWSIPSAPGEAILRLAMVHDVLHERFNRHGPTWYAARQARTRAELDRLPADDPTVSGRRMALLDDLAVGCERLGRPAEGVPILRAKLAQQRAELPDRGGVPPELYTTCANLGTLLIHANLGPAIAGDEAAQAALREGLGFIRQAMAANPHAHFGRETWQAEAVEILLAAIAEPERLLQYDLVGIELDGTWRGRSRVPGEAMAYWRLVQDSGGFDALQSRIAAGDRTLAGAVREFIPTVYRPGTQSGPAITAFDEPVLGLIGMWTLGGGANPHSALALAHIMESIGQRRLAWDAYERAVELGGGFWPDPGIRGRLAEHCRQRQDDIARSLAVPQAELRDRHRAELAAGLEHRRAFQADEAARLAAGGDPGDPGLQAALLAAHPSPAMPPGDEDLLFVDLPSRWVDLLPVWLGVGSTLVLLAIGVFALIRALRPAPAVDPEDGPNAA